MLNIASGVSLNLCCIYGATTTTGVSYTFIQLSIIFNTMKLLHPFSFFFSNKIAALILTYLQQKRNKTTMLQHIRRRERDRGRKKAYKDITGCACRCVLSTWVLRMKLHWHVVCMAYIAQILGCFIEGTSEHEQQIETIQTCW